MLKYFKIYSIDISLGAVISAWFIAYVVSLTLSWYIYAVIFVAIWSVYTIDHILDARQLKGEQGPARYSHHLTNFLPVLAIMGFAVGGALTIVFTLLPKELIRNGFIMVAAVLLYFFFRLFLKKIFSGLKEFVAAIVYTVGVSLATFYYYDGFAFYLYLVLLQFFCLVFANLLICSMWDEKWDKAHSYDSMTILFGRAFIKGITVSLISISMISSAVGIFIYAGHNFNIQVVIFAMNACLSLFYFYGGKLEENVQRFLIDSIFFIPLILLLL